MTSIIIYVMIMINFLADTFYCPGEIYSHPSSWICDGYSDCYDGYDEIGCGENLDFSANCVHLNVPK
jgi:hypothetical protein